MNYDLRTISSYGNPYTFTGREIDSLDANTFRIMYYRARSYDPQTGRFLQRDPLKYVDGMNLYEYAKSNPIIFTDSEGKAVDPIPSPIEKKPTPDINSRTKDGYRTDGQWGSDWFFIAGMRSADKPCCCKLTATGHLHNRWYWAVDKAAEQEELWELKREESSWPYLVGLYKAWSWAENGSYKCEYISLVATMLNNGSRWLNWEAMVDINKRDMKKHPNPDYEKSLETAKKMSAEAEKKYWDALNKLNEYTKNPEEALCCGCSK